jgi:chemotaxis protein CheX
MERQPLQHSYEAEINQTVGDLFRTMLNTDVTPTSDSVPPGQDMVTAMMAFAGAWKGNLVLACHRTQALRFAQRFLQCDDLDESSDDVSSSLAELSNIIAGNLKAVMPSGVNIGTPSVIEGQNYAVRICGGKVINHTVFTTDAGPFSVRLIEDASLSKGASCAS